MAIAAPTSIKPCVTGNGPGSIPPAVILSAPRPVGGTELEVEWQTGRDLRGIWLIDQQTLRVIANKPAPFALCDALRQPRQQIHPAAEVQLVSGQNSDCQRQQRYWLRWEALSIARDVAHRTGLLT